MEESKAGISSFVNLTICYEIVLGICNMVLRGFFSYSQTLIIVVDLG